MPDVHKNFAASTVAVAPATPTAGLSLTVQSGDGAAFGAPHNAVVWPAGAQPTRANAEIVRVTAIAGDVLTIVRGPQAGDPGGINRPILVGDQIEQGPTAKNFTDVERVATVARAYRNNPLNLTGAVWTKVAYDAVAANNDPGGNFDYATNHRYVCPVAGFYQVQASLNATSTAANQTMELAIYKNGTPVSYGPNVQVAASGAILGAGVNDIVYCAAGDYLEIFYICVAALAAYAAISTNYVAISQVGP